MLSSVPPKDMARIMPPGAAMATGAAFSAPRSASSTRAARLAPRAWAYSRARWTASSTAWRRASPWAGEVGRRAHQGPSTWVSSRSARRVVSSPRVVKSLSSAVMWTRPW